MSCVDGEAEEDREHDQREDVVVRGGGTGLVGARPCSQETKVGGSPMATAWSPMPATKACAAARSTARARASPCVAATPKNAAKKISTVNRMTARTTRPPVLAASATEAMPVMMSDDHQRHDRHAQRVEPKPAKRFDDLSGAGELRRVAARPARRRSSRRSARAER